VEEVVEEASSAVAGGLGLGLGWLGKDVELKSELCKQTVLITNVILSLTTTLCGHVNVSVCVFGRDHQKDCIGT